MSDESARYRDAAITVRTNIVDPLDPRSNLQGRSRIGFQVKCDATHVAAVDPIVTPGGRSGHLHQFFGNPNVTRNSTTQSLADTPTDEITCSNPNDKSAYWTPVVYQNGVEVEPTKFAAYYRSRNPNTVPIPFGLRMIAGDANATESQTFDRGSRWEANGEHTFGSNRMVTAEPGGQVVLRVRFPSCWDGVHLDSPDHQSHMAYPDGDNCPASHPVRIPMVATFTHYDTKGGAGLSLSSGAWYTMHQDFWNVWSPDHQEAMHARCNLQEVHCGSPHKAGPNSPRVTG